MFRPIFLEYLFFKSKLVDQRNLLFMLEKSTWCCGKNDNVPGAFTFHNHNLTVLFYGRLRGATFSANSHQISVETAQFTLGRGRAPYS